MSVEVGGVAICYKYYISLGSASPIILVNVIKYESSSLYLLNVSNAEILGFNSGLRLSSEMMSLNSIIKICYDVINAIVNGVVVEL